MGRRGYPPEFRRRAVALVEAGRKVRDVARDLGVTEQSIYAWRKQDRIDRGLAARNLVFAVVMRATDDAAAIIADLDEDGSGPAYDTGGRVRDGAQVREVPELVPGWAPAGTRAIVRRDVPTPGAQLRLWDHNGLRHQVTLTNDDTDDPTVIERDHRGHARVENRIKNLKDTGLSRLPFASWDANRVWVELVQIAALLLAGLQTLVDDDELAVAEPRRVRYTLLHVAARITHHARRTWLRLDHSWPWTHQLLTAHQQLDRLQATTA